jgi:hypothetical protein
LLKALREPCFKDEQREAGGDQFRQLIVPASATIFNRAHVLKQLREEVVDSLI